VHEERRWGEAVEYHLMRLAFYKGRYGNPVDWLICFFTNGPYSHVEMQFSNGECFSSSRIHGVRFTERGSSTVRKAGAKRDIRKSNFKPHQWDFVEFYLPVKTEDRLRVFCEAQVGKKYDVLGVLGFVWPLRQDRKKWFCSEVIVAALHHIGLLPWIKASRTSPVSLFRVFTEIYAAHPKDQQEDLQA
jgi:hypothetical protein